MTIDNYQNLLVSIDYWLRSQCTGTPKVFADKLNLSPRRLRDYLNYIRAKGASISYSRRRRTYYYDTPGEFHVDIFFQKK